MYRGSPAMSFLIRSIAWLNALCTLPVVMAYVSAIMA